MEGVRRLRGRGWSGREFMAESWKVFENLVDWVVHLENGCIIEIELYVLFPGQKVANKRYM